MCMTNWLPAEEENTIHFPIGKKNKPAWETGNSDSRNSGSDTVSFQSFGQGTWVLSVTESIINYIFWLFEWLILLMFLKCFANETETRKNSRYYNNIRGSISLFLAKTSHTEHHCDILIL